jgi:hypothetical protein
MTTFAADGCKAAPFIPVLGNAGTGVGGGGELAVEVIYRFGDFELDAVRCALRQRGTCADVQPRVLRLYSTS